MSVSNGNCFFFVCFTLFDLCDHVPLFAIHKHKGVMLTIPHQPIRASRQILDSSHVKQLICIKFFNCVYNRIIKLY